MTLERFLSGFACALTFSAQTVAACEVDISDYVGWQIIFEGTVTGHINDYGEMEDGFEGCEHGRVLVWDYDKSITCAEYSYSYAYHPDIVILSDGLSMEACIDDEMYEVRR